MMDLVWHLAQLGKEVLIIYVNVCVCAAGLTVGDPVLRTGNPLSVELGPGK